MKRHGRIIIASLSVVAVVAGLRLLATQLSVKLDGSEWSGIETCAENQKKLYQSVEWELQEHGKLPEHDFQIRGWQATETWKCPACERGYRLQLENYGDPQAVVIADDQDEHPTTFMWWFRGFHPRVQTMGDGTIQLFKGGKVLTMVGSKKK